MFTLRGLVIVDFTYDSTIKSSEELELVLIKSIKLFSKILTGVRSSTKLAFGNPACLKRCILGTGSLWRK